MKFAFALSEGHLEAHVRPELLRRVHAAAAEMASTAQGECSAVLELAQVFCPEATGQTKEGLHLIPSSKTSEGYVCGVGMERSPNQQEVTIEAGRMPCVHTSMEDHDHGRLCSSGDSGGWQQGDEPVNVRGEGSVGANPQARQQPLGAAIFERLGPVVDFRAAKYFRKGAVNTYPRSVFGIEGCRIERVMKEAARRKLEIRN